MARKINVKLILELRAAGMGRNAIAGTRHISRTSVSDVFHIAEELGITADDVHSLSEQEVYRRFFPEKHATENLYNDPDYEYIHKELTKKGVTLKLLWEEYRDKCKPENDIPMGYTRFCEHYRRYTIEASLTNHIERKPGQITEVDWAGAKMSYINHGTGEIIPVYLFVSALPYSQYSYVEPCLDMKQDTWLRCHVHMYSYYGGVTSRTVCDNLKTGVISHPREGDIILNENYEALGTHYMTAIMPTGVGKPKHKPSVEGAVGFVTTAIVAKLRNEQFTSFAQLKEAVAEKLTEYNNEPFQKREYSRSEVFKEESMYFHPLPEIPYEIASWIYGRSVNLNCHVVFEKNYYSCPYQHVGKKADLKVTDTSVEVFIEGERTATHNRFHDFEKNRYSTHPEDMPDRFNQPEWDDVRIRRWAGSIGIYTNEVINRIFQSVKIKEQGYNPSLSVLRLSKPYSQARLEAACELALTKVRVPRYNHLKAILAANQDIEYLENKKASYKRESEILGYVRGAEYYGGDSND